MKKAFLLLSGMVFACGGKVVFDGVGTGGAPSTSSSQAATTSSSSTSMSSSSTGTTCPTFPAIGSSCSLEGSSCPVPFGCCGGQAVCANGKWTYVSPPCNEACIPCGGGLTCETNALCVSFQFDIGASFECRQDPCPGQPTCDCEQQLCAEQGLSCGAVMLPDVLCDCPNC